MKVPLLDLRAQYQSIREEIDSAIARVMERGNYVMGEEVEAFEAEWARFCGAKYCVGVSSGTDAIYLALLALATADQEEPKRVLTTPLTFFATAQAILHAGLTPSFVDVGEDGNIDLPEGALPGDLVVPVHLYGRPARVERKGGSIVEDAAQAHGIPFNPDARAVCFSFYPSKNLGAYGQAGAVVTNDPEIADLVRLFRTYGERERFVHYFPTGNHRMDELQAAVLRAKLPHLKEWNETRRWLARAYRLNGLPGIVTPVAVGWPQAHPGHVYHIVAIRVTDPRGRDSLAALLAENGIQTAVRYPLPLHLQPALDYLGYKRGDFPKAEAWAKTNLSLPIYPEMSLEMVEYVCEKVKEWVEG